MKNAEGAKHTREQLHYLQALPLDLKIRLTKNRLREWLDSHESYVSFSGGKDSTVLLHIAREVQPDIKGVFIDTGLEYPEIREFVKTRNNIVWLKPDMNFKQVILKYGYPLISKDVAAKIELARKYPDRKVNQLFEENNDHDNKYGARFSITRYKDLKNSDIPISAQCCTIMKKRPAKKFEKETGLYPIVGSMACESTMRTTSWLRQGCNVFDSMRPVSRPLSFWTEQDILLYIKKNNLSYCSVYGDILEENGKLQMSKCQRTGCVFCAFGAHCEKNPNRFQRLKETHPVLYDYCMRPIENGGLGMKEILQKINIETE